MNATEQIKAFHEFFERHYHASLYEKVRKGEEYASIDFPDLLKFNTVLAELLLDEPEETLKAMEIAVKQFDFDKELTQFHVRVTNLPKNQKMLVRDIRSKHLGQLLWIEGVVRQKSDVRPQVTMARFECPSCGNLIF